MRDSPWLSYLDDAYPDILDDQQISEAKIKHKEIMVREAAQQMGMSAQEARIIHEHKSSTTHHNYYTTNNTYTGDQNPKPPPPGRADMGVGIDARNTADMGTETDHPLKHGTGTGTDYTPPPDRYDPQWKPPPNNQPTVITTSSSRTGSRITEGGGVF